MNIQYFVSNQMSHRTSHYIYRTNLCLRRLADWKVVSNLDIRKPPLIQQHLKIYSHEHNFKKKFQALTKSSK